MKYYPNDALLKKCKPCDLSQTELVSVSREMNDIMIAYDGVGLAAPQVGLDIRLFVMRYSQAEPKDKSNFVVFSNPVITEHSHIKPAGFEGCLSLCGVKTKVKRWEWIHVEFDDFDKPGSRITWWEQGMRARIIQHETDHLDGILILDRIESKLAQKVFLEKYYKARKIAGRRDDL